MREIPILFNVWSMGRLLAQEKTQTRRVNRKALDLDGKSWAHSVVPARETGWVAWWGTGQVWASAEERAEFTKQEFAKGFRCPYGEPGDLLWVREPSYTPVNGDTWTRRYHYTVDDAPTPLYSNRDKPNKKAAMHLPRKASRLTLLNEEVRAQRLQDITEEDAIAEGCVSSIITAPEGATVPFSAREHYRAIWTSIHGADGPESWNSNPQVFAVTFKRVPQQEVSEMKEKHEQ